MKKIEKYLGKEEVSSVDEKITSSAQATAEFDKLVSAANELVAFFKNKDMMNYLAETDKNFGTNLVQKYKKLFTMVPGVKAQIDLMNSEFMSAE